MGGSGRTRKAWNKNLCYKIFLKTAGVDADRQTGLSKMGATKERREDANDQQVDWKERASSLRVAARPAPRGLEGGGEDGGRGPRRERRHVLRAEAEQHTTPHQTGGGLGAGPG